MDISNFEKRKEQVFKHYQELLSIKNKPEPISNGIYQRYKWPILTKNHIPPVWKYDLNEKRNPFFMERMGINAVFNAGAVLIDEKVKLFCRVEGADRKSFFAVATSENGIDHFEFDTLPIALPQTEEPDTNVYDMRITKHEDGWYYGIFCTERKMKDVPESDTSSAVAQTGMIRSKDLKVWERLPDLKTHSPQQRNCVLHPEFVKGNYAFYTRPQDGFIEAGEGGGIGWGICKDITNALIEEESIIEGRQYHTIKESKNGQGPPPLKTKEGWLHLAHGVRNTAAGLRYVLYLFMTDLIHPQKVIKRPAGYLIAPEKSERIGDVSNVVFSNGWIAKPNGDVLIYYASSDTRMHVAASTIAQLVDYVNNTPEDPLFSHLSVEQRIKLIQRNEENS